MTNAERLTRIETILERVDRKLDVLEGDMRADVADLAALKNRGVGLLVGVGLAGGALGAAVSKYIEPFLK